MYLKSLSINGFKSFAKKGELLFETPITAIVGPNGSGKSNVAEAFRFVLGEQSVKSMRGKRGEDLIFNGTEKVSRSNRASVEVLLDNSQKVFPVDFSEVRVERIVHRDGQNEYKINGSKVRLKDVQELLAAANIGPTGHHIISQGEADRILSASARERREMIEDALGLKVFQFKKQEAERKLKKTEENIERVQSLRREVAPHLKYLERQMQKIAKKRELAEELKTVYAEYLKREDVVIAHSLERVESALRQPRAERKDIDAALESAKQVLAAAEQDDQRDALLQLERSLREARDHHQALLRKHAQLEGQVEFLERRLEQSRQSQDDDGSPVPFVEVKGMVETLSRQVEEVVQSDDVSRLRRMLSDIKTALQTFLKKAKTKPDASAVADEAECEDRKAELARMERGLTEALERVDAAQTQYDTLRTEIEAEAEGSREAEREVFRLVNAQRDLDTKIAALEQERSVFLRDRDEFKRELQEAVALIGRSASDYFHVEVIADGAVVTPEMMIAEDRSVQRERRRALEKLKIRLEEMGGSGEDVENEYKTVKERDEFLEQEIADLEVSVANLETLIADLAAQLNEQFGVGIEKISAEFNRFFTLMFGGGKAALELVKPKKRKRVAEDEALDVTDEPEEEEVEEGIELAVSLPNKKVSGLEMLSGGERALTSIALIFAMSQVNPPLFVILDETDAALDEANSRRYGDMIEALAKKSQLILITHNRETMSRAGILYGVTMAGDGVSKLLSVKFDEAAAHAK